MTWGFQRRHVLRAIDIFLVGCLALSLGISGFKLWRDVAVARAAADLKASFNLRDYIDLKSIVVDDAKEGGNIYLHVIRDIHQDFDGFYRVTIRHADGGSVVCSTGRISIPYRAHDSAGNPTQLPEPLLLSYWAEGGDCTADIRDGLSPGTYALETCHGHDHPPGFNKPQELCWTPLPIFKVLPRRPYEHP